MSGQCDQCGEHCLDCKYGIQNLGCDPPGTKIKKGTYKPTVFMPIPNISDDSKEILNKTFRQHIENAIAGLDGNMMCHYYDDKYNSKEFNAGCVYAFALAKGALEACLRLEDMKNE